MKKTLLFVLTLSGLTAPATSVIKEYHYVKMLKTWTEAQSYCREKFTDLAAVENQSDNDGLLSVLQGLGDYAWIGLYDNTMAGWKWALGDADFNNEYSKWLPGQPNSKNSNESCAFIKRIKGLWFDVPCSERHHAVCYYEKGPSKYIINKTLMTWYEARTYCRSRYTDLVSVRNQSENDQIHSLLQTKTWLGLHRKTWAYWSDQTPKTFTHWEGNYPQNTNDEKSCVMVDTNTGMWSNDVCDIKKHFICQKVYSHQQQTFKLKFQSKADLKDPAIQQQLLEQLHAKLEKHGLSDFKLRWTQKDGQAFHKEHKMKKEKEPVW